MSGQEVLENGVSTSFALGTKITTCTIKRKFLRRRLLYFPNGTESFNPVMSQIILSGDVHPHPGPNLNQKQNSHPGQDSGGGGQGGGRGTGGGISTMAGSGREIQKGKLLLFVTAYFQSKKRTQ